MKTHSAIAEEGVLARWIYFWLGAGVLFAGGEIIGNAILGRFPLLRPLWLGCPGAAIPGNTLLYFSLIAAAGLIFGFLAELFRRLAKAGPSLHPAVALGLLVGFGTYLGYGVIASGSSPGPVGGFPSFRVYWWWGGGGLVALAAAVAGYASKFFRQREKSLLKMAALLLGGIAFNIADIDLPVAVSRIGLLFGAAALAGGWGFIFHLGRVTVRRLTLVVGLAAGGVCLLQSIHFSRPQKGYDRHLVFFLWDAQRPDRMSVYGEQYATTPVLLSLADRMIRFERAYSPANYTFASAVSIFTGRYLREHHLYDGTAADIARYDRFRNLAGDMAGQGYRPVMITESPWLVALRRNFREVGNYPTRRDTASIFFPFHRSPFLGIQIIDHISFLQDGLFKSTVVRRQDRFLTDLLLRARRDGPYFLYVCWMNAHSRYYPGGKGIRSTNPGALRAVPESDYLRATEYMDCRLGEWVGMLRKAGQWERSLAILTADHGEFLGEFGMVGHGKTLLEPALRVPLLLFGPGVVPEVVEEPVPLVALRKSISALADRQPGGWETEAFIRKMVNNRGMVVEGSFDFEGPDNAVRWFLACWDGRMKYMQDRHKYIPDDFVGLDTESFHFLYDLAADPGELRNLAAERPEAVARMRELIERWEATLDPAPPPPPEGEEEKEYPPGLAEQMRALGYDI